MSQCWPNGKAWHNSTCVSPLVGFQMRRLGVDLFAAVEEALVNATLPISRDRVRRRTRCVRWHLTRLLRWCCVGRSAGRCAGSIGTPPVGRRFADHRQGHCFAVGIARFGTIAGTAAVAVGLCCLD